MIDYGQIIAKLRKDNNLTQAELGAKLNVTCQAVSKWENNQSQPDFATMAQIADLFNVPLSIFQENTAATSATQSNRIHEIVGYCKDCGNAVTQENLAQQRPVLLCKTCVDNRKAQQERAEQLRKEEIERQQQLAEARKQQRADKIKHIRNKGLIWGAVVGILFMIIGSISVAQEKNAGELIATAIVLGVFLFTFMSQMFWDGFVHSTALFGGKIVGMPGVIFTLDLDGMIFLIGVKILFAVLRMLIFLITFAIGFVFALIVSPFTFVPALLRVNRGDIDSLDDIPSAE